MPLLVRPYRPDADPAALRARFAEGARPPWAHLAPPYDLESLLAGAPEVALYVAEARRRPALGLIAVVSTDARPRLVGPLVADDQLAELVAGGLIRQALAEAGQPAPWVLAPLNEPALEALYAGFGYVRAPQRELGLIAEPRAFEAPEAEGLAFTICPQLVSSDYLALYEGIGKALGWSRREGWSRDRIFEHLHRKDVSLWVAKAEDRYVGFAEVLSRPDHTGELLHFGLLPEARGEGRGSAFLRYVLKQAWEKLGLTRLDAVVSTDAPEACLRLGGRLGFSLAWQRALLIAP